ncbi:MAG TPA: hypothetical protein VEH51_01965 [Burkholderiales bacterium]|nr:hypothetical protein [Burkholderiales bacterium]
MLQDLRQFKDTSVLLQTVAGFWLLALVLIGVCGSILEVIAPHGWLARTLGPGASLGAAAIISLVFVATVGWFAREWASAGDKHRITDVVLYAFAGAGLIFLWQMATGSGF